MNQFALPYKNFAVGIGHLVPLHNCFFSLFGDEHQEKLDFTFMAGWSFSSQLKHKSFSWGYCISDGVNFLIRIKLIDAVLKVKEVKEVYHRAAVEV